MPASKGPRAGRSKAGGNKTEDKVTRGRQKAEEDVGLLDNPDIADQPSEIRHVLYFAGVLAFAVVLNLVAMILVAGGQ
jgi:hypothetical protein